MPIKMTELENRIADRIKAMVVQEANRRLFGNHPPDEEHKRIQLKLLNVEFGPSYERGLEVSLKLISATKQEPYPSADIEGVFRDIANQIKGAAQTLDGLPFQVVDERSHSSGTKTLEVPDLESLRKALNAMSKNKAEHITTPLDLGRFD